MKEASRWWKHSLSDLKTAEYNLKGDMLNAAAFYSQQAAEKALKALQIKRLSRFERTRDLVHLAKSVEAPHDIIELCELIAPFYTVTRYLDVEVSSVVEASRKAAEWVERSLK